jgi:putative flippase GtrA
MTDIPSLIRQSRRYLIVGFSSAAIELALAWILYEALGLRAQIGIPGATLVLSNAVAIVVATIYNFILSRKWTFSSVSSLPRSATLFLILFVFNQWFSNTVIAALMSAGAMFILAKIFTMGCIVCWNFFLYRLVVFK